MSVKFVTSVKLLHTCQVSQLNTWVHHRLHQGW